MNYTKRIKEKKKETTYCHRLPHNNTAIEEGDNIAAVTFFTVKPLKKAMTIIIINFCNKTIKEGDGSCRLLFLLYNTTIKESDNSLVLSPSLL
jgi:hypothetical protein